MMIWRMSLSAVFSRRWNLWSQWTVPVDAAHCCSSALFSITKHSRHTAEEETQHVAYLLSSFQTLPVGTTASASLPSHRWVSSRTATLRCKAGCEAVVWFPCPLHQHLPFPPAERRQHISSDQCMNLMISLASAVICKARRSRSNTMTQWIFLSSIRHPRDSSWSSKKNYVLDVFTLPVAKYQDHAESTDVDTHFLTRSLCVNEKKKPRINRLPSYNYGTQLASTNGVDSRTLETVTFVPGHVGTADSTTWLPVSWSPGGNRRRHGGHTEQGPRLWLCQSKYWALIVRVSWFWWRRSTWTARLLTAEYRREARSIIQRACRECGHLPLVMMRSKSQNNESESHNYVFCILISTLYLIITTLSHTSSTFIS